MTEEDFTENPIFDYADDTRNDTFSGDRYDTSDDDDYSRPAAKTGKVIDTGKSATTRR